MTGLGYWGRTGFGNCKHGIGWNSNGYCYNDKISNAENESRCKIIRWYKIANLLFDYLYLFLMHQNCKWYSINNTNRLNQPLYLITWIVEDLEINLMTIQIKIVTTLTEKSTIFRSKVSKMKRWHLCHPCYFVPIFYHHVLQLCFLR